MRLSFLLAFHFITFHSIAVRAQECKCKALAGIMLQPRGPEKEIIDQEPAFKRMDTISIAEVYSWQQRYQKAVSSITWNPHKRSSARKAGTPEDTLYTLKGYMWLVKKVGFDCDFHIEIGNQDSASTRIIVEVPYKNRQLQLKIFHHLDSIGFSVEGCNERQSKNAHFIRGVPVVISGYGFYDSFHKINTNHGDSHTKKYIWELHPVISLEFLQE